MFFLEGVGGFFCTAWNTYLRFTIHRNISLFALFANTEFLYKCKNKVLDSLIP